MSTLKRNLVGLPRASEAAGGQPPSDNPGPLGALMADYYEERLAEPERPTATGTRLRASWAGRCARQIQYRLQGTPAAPPDLPGAWSMDRGKIVHSLLDRFALARNWQVEVPVAVAPDLSATVDFYLPDENVTLELKTTGGYSYKIKATPDRGAPEGPSHGDVTQAALGAYGLDADVMWLGLVSMEAVSKYIAERHELPDLTRIAASWSYDRAAIAALAEPEIARLTDIVACHDAGLTVDRFVPLTADQTVHITARNGAWQQTRDGEVVDTGRTWHCDYCPFADHCWSS